MPTDTDKLAQEPSDQDDDKLQKVAIDSKEKPSKVEHVPKSDAKPVDQVAIIVSEAENFEKSTPGATIEEQCDNDKANLKQINNNNVQDAAETISIELDPEELKAKGYPEITNKSQSENGLPSKKRVSISISNEVQILNANNDEVKQQQLLEPTGYFRFGVAILTLFSILLANMNRQAFNQALDEMILPKNGKRIDENDQRLDWTNIQTGELKAAFSMGYCIFMIPSARLGEIMGTKWIIFASTFGSGLCSMLVPYLALNNHFTILKISRFAMGVCQAGVAPALFAIVARWLSPKESCTFLPLIKGGVSFGLLFGAGSVGLLRWQTSFYFCGGVAVVVSIVWVFYVTSLPEQNQLLTQSELEFIQQQMELRDGIKKNQEIELENNKNDEVETKQDKTTTKSKDYSAAFINEAKLWARLFFNWPVIGVMLVKWTMRLSTDAQTQYLSSFFHNVHGLSKGDNSTVNCINYAIQGILTIHIVWLVTYCIEIRVFNLNKTGIRRLFQCGCSFGMAAAYLLVTLDLKSLTVSLWAIVLLALTNILQSGADSMMPYDLSPTYSGTIMGVANSFANSAGVILPKIVNSIVGNDVKNLENWRNLFYIVSGLIGSGGFIFILLVKAKVQPFDPAYEHSRLRAKEEREARAKKRQEIHIEMTQVNSIMKNKPQQQQSITTATGDLQTIVEQKTGESEPVTSTDSGKPKLSQMTFSEWRATKEANRSDSNKSQAEPVNVVHESK